MSDKSRKSNIFAGLKGRNRECFNLYFVANENLPKLHLRQESRMKRLVCLAKGFAEISISFVVKSIYIYCFCYLSTHCTLVKTGNFACLRPLLQIQKNDSILWLAFLTISGVSLNTFVSFLRLSESSLLCHSRLWVFQDLFWESK